MKVKGMWVSPVEIESALLEHSSVQEAAVVGIADSNELTKPSAYVVYVMASKVQPRKARN